MQNPKRKNGDVSRASSFPSPKPHGPGRKKSSIVEFTSLGNCPWIAEYIHTKSCRPSRAKQSTELDCSCAHLSGAKIQKTRVCFHQRKIAGQRCPWMIMLETASNIIQRVLKHPGPRQHLQPLLPAQTCFKAHRGSHQGQAGVTQITVH